MKANSIIDPARSIVASKPDVINQKPQSDSTSASFGDEAQKLFIENNTNNKLNLKNNNKNKNNMELQSVNDDIFPKERQGGSSNYFNTELNNQSNIQINSNVNSPENTFEKNKEIILANDIPEMLLYKYNYDINLYKESLNDIEYEVNWMYDYLNMAKYNKKLIDQRDIKSCLKNLLTYHKVKKCDIPYIVANYENIYKKFFLQNEVFEILSVYDAEFLRLQKKRKKVLKFYDYIQQKNGEWELGKEIDKNYLQKKYILEAKTDLELDLIEALLGILTYVNQSNELDENCKAMINVEILKNLNIDYSLLNKVKDDKLDEIIKQFCLYPEQVVHNLKVINGEINDKIIEPPFPGCPLNDLCKKAMVETAGKYASTKDILMTSFQYYNLILALNPYIFNLIYKKLYDIYTLSTEPTEKGKEILNSLHPFYHCKRINKMPIKYFFEEKNDSLCNLYTKNFGEIFIDIEKCSNSGLIKYILNIPESPDETLNLKNILSKACNGLNDKMEIVEENPSTNPNDKILKKKFIGARNLCLDNLLIISKGFFLNIIKTKLHNYSEKSLIKKISNEFFNIISRNLKGRITLDNAYIFSIIFNSQKNYFKLFIISPNWIVKQKKELHYIWKNDNLMEGGFEIALNSSEEQVELHKYLTSYCPKAIVLDVSNLESYKMINFIRNKFRDYNLIYSDYSAKVSKMKSYQMTEQQEEQTAVEQLRYVINPVNQIIDLWRYKYEDNLLLNLSLHPLQDNIKDIPLLCYSLETQVIRVVNSKGIYLNDLTKYSFNLFNFVSGFGPSTSSIIIKNLRSPNEITNSLRKNCPNIYNNVQMFLLENKILPFNLYKLNRNEEETGLLKSEIFSAMIKDKIYFKKLSLCNAVVNNVDLVNRVINCYLLRGENNIKALLRFIDMDTNIKNPQQYFYPQRIILCKIIDISLRHNSYEIYITNKNEELITVKDFFLDQCKNANSKIAEKYTTLEEDDFIIKDIKKLKETQKANEDKNIDQKKLKYSLISLENEQILRNVTYNTMKKIIRMDYVVRPSFRGDNYLILSFYLIDDIYLNYDIEIITKKEQNEESNNTITEYKLGNNIYNSLTDLVNKFASKMKNSIENFRKNDYFKKPEEIRELFTKIFGIENPVNSLIKKEKNKIEIKIKKKDYEKDNIKTNAMNVIILGFMKEEPEYGIIFTKTSDELNYTLDFIKLMCNGYLFHGVFYTNLNEIIFFLKEKRKTPQYQNFLKSQFICTTHRQIEEIDEEYYEFDGIDPNLEKYNKAAISYNDLNNLKNNLLNTNNNNENINNNSNNNLLGKKRTGGDIWGNDLGNNNVEDVWGVSNENVNEDNGWNIKKENKEENIWGGNDLNENKDNAWGMTIEDNKTDKKNISEWNTDLNNNNDWADGNNNNEGNNDWNNSNNNKRQNNKFNNKKSYSNGSNKNDKFEKPRNKKFNNNNNNNRNKGDWKNKDKKNKESSFSWVDNNNQEKANDNWNTGNNNKENNTSDNWANNNNNNQNDYWGGNAETNNDWGLGNNNTNTNNEWNTGGDNNKNDTWGKSDNNTNNAWTENKNDTWGKSDNNTNNAWTENKNDTWGKSDNITNNAWTDNNDNKKNKKDGWNNKSNKTWGKKDNNKKDGWKSKNDNNNSSNDAWGSNNGNDEWGSSNNNNANDTWGKNNSNKNDEWGSSNNNANNEWASSDNKKDEWGSGNNNEWGSSNNNKKDEWGSSNNHNKNDEWGSNNNNNKNDEWGSNNNNNNNNEWGSSNNNNKNDEWGSNNNNNENNWGKNQNDNGWGSNDNNNNNNNNNINDPWSESKENKNKTNISSWDSWDGNNTNNKDINDNDNAWADNNKKNSFNNFNKGNKNNFNKNNNNNRRNFSHNNRNNNSNKKNNNSTYVSNWGSNNYQNSKNKFGSKGKKNEKRWANELDKNYGETDIKQEKEEGIVDFENYEGFGGYETKNDQNNE